MIPMGLLLMLIEAIGNRPPPVSAHSVYKIVGCPTISVSMGAN